MSGACLFVVEPAFHDYIVGVVDALALYRECRVSTPSEWRRLADGVSVVVTVHSTLPFLEDLRASGLACLTLQDGIIEDEHLSLRRQSKLDRYQPLMTDRICVFGRNSADALIALGTAASRVDVTGSPRFDALADLPPPVGGGGVLVASAITPYFDDRQRIDYLASMIRLRDALTAMRIPVRYRLSGKVRVELSRQSDRSSWEEVGAFERERCLLSDLTAAEAVVTTASTLALQAMICGRPVALLCPANRKPNLLSAWRIGDQTEVADVVTDMLDPASERLTHQNALLLSEHLSGRSTERVVEIINRMASAA